MQIARLWCCFRIACHLHLPASLDLHSRRMQRRLCTPYHQMVIRWDPSLAFAKLQIYSSSIAQESGSKHIQHWCRTKAFRWQPKDCCIRCTNPSAEPSWTQSMIHSSCTCHSRSKLTTKLFLMIELWAGECITLILQPGCCCWCTWQCRFLGRAYQPADESAIGMFEMY